MWLTLSHSARPLDFSRSSRDALIARFGSPERLLFLPSFEELTEVDAPHWSNNITVWSWNAKSGLELVLFLERPYTVNHALVNGCFESLVVCAHDHLEFCSLTGDVDHEVTHNWFAGGHTVYRDDSGNLVVSCAASDSVLTFDGASQHVVDAWRLPPNLYGVNYSLSIDADVRRHYIGNDAQISHINSAYPWRGMIFLTCFIQGSILCVRGDGTVRELLSGFVGCHGAKISGKGGLYFADSPRGEIVWTQGDGSIAAKISCNSSWLHDVVWLCDDYYACAIGDRNELAIIETGTNTALEVLDLSRFGETPCLLSSGRI